MVISFGTNYDEACKIQPYYIHIEIMDVNITPCPHVFSVCVHAAPLLLFLIFKYFTR